MVVGITANVGELVLLAISGEADTTGLSVSGVSGCGVTWTSQVSKTFANGSNSAFLYVFTATMPSAITCNITATTTAPVDDGNMVAKLIYNQSGLDPDASLPATASNSGGTTNVVATGPFSTTTYGTLGYTFVTLAKQNVHCYDGSFAPTGWTTTTGGWNNGAVYWNCLGAYSLSSINPLTSQSAITSQSNNYWAQATVFISGVQPVGSSVMVTKENGYAAANLVGDLAAGITKELGYAIQNNVGDGAAGITKMSTYTLSNNAGDGAAGITKMNVYLVVIPGNSGLYFQGFPN